MSRLTINSNIASLNAQRNFGNATRSLNESYTRLSSGLRINRAVDDAAGLAVSESLKADTRILNQGVRNLNDGVSLLAIADGALGELSSITIRLRELASQSSNGTLSNKQRGALDQEAQSLSKEYNRIARSTSFNGLNIFDGDFGVLNLAAGGGVESLIRNGLGGGIGDGTFKARVSYANGAVASDISLADFDGDGNLDVVLASLSSNSVNIFYGNSDGSFNSRISYTAGSNPNFIQYADFNRDGILDVVTTDGGSGSLSVYLGNGGRNGFKARTIYSAGTTPESVQIEDFNNDGTLDLIASDRSGTVGVYLGNGDGTFKTRVSMQIGTLPRSVTTNDFNGDGILDFAVALQTDERMSVFFGNGDGSFKSAGSYESTGQPDSIINADINGDGIVDLVTANYSYSQLNTYLGNGDGTFRARISIQTSTGPTSVKSADFNGDGKLDLLSIDNGSNVAGVLLGNGDGTFKTRVTYSVGNGATNSFIADLNRDGIQDVVVADYTGNSFSVLFGNGNDGVSALQSFSLKTKYKAETAMSYLTDVLNLVSKQRGQIGAFQSRVDVALNTLKTTSLNYSDANSRITDADVAQESSKLVANQILQKAAASVLAQANQQPQMALRLLQNI